MSIQKFLTDIYETGINDYEIARMLGSNQPQINRLRLGKQQTSYDFGKKIEKLAEDILKTNEQSQPSTQEHNTGTRW